MNEEKKYTVIGVMSGTSLDGLDIAACEYSYNTDVWNFKLIAAETISYEGKWLERLSRVHHYAGFELTKLDFEFGKLIGLSVSNFVERNNINASLIASHGHTVFHKPNEGITLQIGKGSEISALANLPVVCDFRTCDVALGGQGAPLVPMGEKMLFKEFDSFLNIGGFANISVYNEGIMKAWDVCPANIILNYVAQRENKRFDFNGEMSAQGNIVPGLLHELNNLPYYFKDPPKSLGREWLEEEVFALINRFDGRTYDIMRTLTEHIAIQIALTFKKSEKKTLFITGGGALNAFLMERLKSYIGNACVLPEVRIIEFKEAVIFGFLGLLRYLNKNNCLSSVTGSSRDNCGGAIYMC